MIHLQRLKLNPKMKKVKSFETVNTLKKEI